MKNCNRNILVYAVNNGSKEGFNIYLAFSGQREYLVTHRHNGLLYGMLKDGIRLEDMRREAREMRPAAAGWRRAGAAKATKLRNSMRYLLEAIDEYVADREQCA